jgi:hypothetical protein
LKGLNEGWIGMCDVPDLAAVDYPSKAAIKPRGKGRSG